MPDIVTYVDHFHITNTIDLCLPAYRIYVFRNCRSLTYLFRIRNFHLCVMTKSCMSVLGTEILFASEITPLTSVKFRIQEVY